VTPLAAAPLGRELLDDPDADPAAVVISLRHIARANRWFGGWAAVRWGLERLLENQPSTPLTLLDVGAGSGDLARRAVCWAAARGIHLRPLALERHPAAARMASATGLPALLACGGCLPVRTAGVDLVLVSQVAHHLAEAACVTLLRECSRVARRGMVVADLARSQLAAAGFWIGSRILRFDPATRADGLTSLRRGFDPPGLARLMALAGCPAAVVRRPGARLVAVWRSP
jgi:hypothetical protein